MKQLLLLFNLIFQIKKVLLSFWSYSVNKGVISYIKTALNTSKELGNAAVNVDQKPSFLRAMTEWVQAWQTEGIPNYKNFPLTAQTSSGLFRTLLCLAWIIEDLLGEEGYGFVLISRFQSNTLERRFVQYWQMNGGRFVVGLRHVTSSEKIIKVNSLLKKILTLIM